jgi:hypothetical protein
MGRWWPPRTSNPVGRRKRLRGVRFPPASAKFFVAGSSRESNRLRAPTNRRKSATSGARQPAAAAAKADGVDRRGLCGRFPPASASLFPSDAWGIEPESEGPPAGRGHSFEEASPPLKAGDVPGERERRRARQAPRRAAQRHPGRCEREPPARLRAGDRVVFPADYACGPFFLSSISFIATAGCPVPAAGWAGTLRAGTLFRGTSRSRQRQERPGGLRQRRRCPRGA